MSHMLRTWCTSSVHILQDLNGHRIKSPFCSLYWQVKHTHPLQLLLLSDIIFTPHLLSEKVVVFRVYKKKPCIYWTFYNDFQINKTSYYVFYYLCYSFYCFSSFYTPSSLTPLLCACPPQETYTSPFDAALNSAFREAIMSSGPSSLPSIRCF